MKHLLYKILYIITGLAITILGVLNWISGYPFFVFNKGKPEFPGVFVTLIIGFVLLFFGLITSVKEEIETEKVSEKAFKRLAKKEKNKKRSQVFNRAKKKKHKRFGVNKKK